MTVEHTPESRAVARSARVKILTDHIAAVEANLARLRSERDELEEVTDAGAEEPVCIAYKFITRAEKTVYKMRVQPDGEVLFEPQSSGMR